MVQAEYVINGVDYQLLVCITYTDTIHKQTVPFWVGKNHVQMTTVLLRLDF